MNDFVCVHPYMRKSYMYSNTQNEYTAVYIQLYVCIECVVQLCNVNRNSSGEKTAHVCE